jgi:Skp family chaperone for outer membrane proteins
MGCGGSKGDSDGPDSNVPGKQGQGDLEAERDAAAAEIQKAAQGYKAKKDAMQLEKAKDEAAAEIQKGAALYMAKKKEKDAASAVEPPSPLVGLQTAASQAVDAIVQLSHRLLGGNDNSSEAKKPEPIEEEPDLSAAAERISQSAGQAFEQSEAEKAKAAAVIQKSQKKRKAKK